MNKIVKSLFLFTTFLIPLHVDAYRHGYNRKTDEIYATVRSDIYAYDGQDWDDSGVNIPQFSGIRVVDKDGGWFQIEYEGENQETRVGWITQDEFYDRCLIYDGRDKQRIADGNYQITFRDHTRQAIYNPFEYKVKMDHTVFDLKFIYVGDGNYQIKKIDDEEYFQPDPLLSTEHSYFWGPQDTAGLFKIARKGDYFTIQDSVSHRYLGKNSSGILCYNSINTPSWQFCRYDKAIDDESIRLFAQFDAEWADYYYGPGENEDPGSNVFTTSACGIFSTMNAIYSLTGMYADPYALADFAVEEEYRILDFGTDNGIFKAAANKFGDKYGFSYDGSGGSLDEVIKKLKKGDTVIAHVPGHYLCIADYDSKKKMFLLLDPHYLPKRGTCAYGDWVKKDVLEGMGQDGNLESSEFFFYKAKRPKKMNE